MGPLPKRRHSHARGADRQSQIKLKNITLIDCPACGAKKLQHTACPTCKAYAVKAKATVSAKSAQ